MKNIIYLSLLACVLMMTGCDDFLDENNQSRVVPTTLDEHLMAIGPFSVRSPFAGHITTFGIRSDDFKIRNEEIMNSDFSSVDGHLFYAMLWEDLPFRPNTIDEEWKLFYQGIWLCNNVLLSLEETPPGENEQELFNRTKGEALAQRAFFYSYLVNDYADHYDPARASTDMGVPINTGLDLEQQLPRSSVADVYDLIINDLNTAAELLPQMTPNFPNSSFRPGVASVYALLARLHLYRQEWEEAVQMANQCLSIYDFIYDYADPDFIPPRWRTENFDREAIWFRIAYTEYFNAPYLRLSDDLISLYDTTGNDLRWNHYTLSFEDQIYSIRAKIRWPNGGGTDYSNNNGVGIPEVILTLAEAETRLGNINGAMSTLDRLTQFRYDPNVYTAPSASTKSEALEIILAERRRELPFTAVRWIDQKRLILLGEYTQTVTRISSDQTFFLEPNSLKYVNLIPGDVIALNPNIDQNPR